MRVTGFLAVMGLLLTAAIADDGSLYYFDSGKKSDKPARPNLEPLAEALRNKERMVDTAKHQLKQIGLAMHNHHERHKQFPAPVMIGPDGKTPHSWRVAILPFLGEKALYNQYKFDEPWDSENNKKLLAKIPYCYRHPLDKPGSTNASYFALVGKNTFMGDGKQGTKFAAIRDGASNTLMIVEAKRDIPWTKPEDISYADDRSKDAPKLGGWFPRGFLAVLGDGSTPYVSQSITKTTLQNLIERNDNNAVGQEYEVEPQDDEAR